MTRVAVVSKWVGGKQVGYKVADEYPGVEEELDLFDTCEVGFGGCDGRDRRKGYGGRVRNEGCFRDRGWIPVIVLT